MELPPPPELSATTIPATLAAVLVRLDTLAQDIHFQSEREIAFDHFLQPYLESGQAPMLQPLPAEIELAKLFLYCDYYPSGGQLSLIEQLRDHITEHVPQEERVWLDPLRHSFMDVLEVTAIGSGGSPHTVRLRSLGDGIEYAVTEESLSKLHHPGHILITRLIRRPEHTVFPGVAIGLSHRRGLVLFDSLRELQQEMEGFSGSFELGEWQEYMKRYGHIIIWTLANLRLKWLVEREKTIRFVTSDGKPFFHCIAIYEHNDREMFRRTLEEDTGWTAETTEQADPTPCVSRETTTSSPFLCTWTKKSSDRNEPHEEVTARLILSRTQLIAETHSTEQLNDLKHWLATTFGFTLHFRGETLTPPAHHIPPYDMLSDDYPDITIPVPQEEEHRILSSLFEGAYLDWAERNCPALQDKTPRHCALDHQGAKAVAALIQEMEAHDLARLRTGKPGFQYDSLRSHVGLV